MANIGLPQNDLPRSFRGGSDSWDNGLTGAIVTQEYFQEPPASGFIHAWALNANQLIGNNMKKNVAGQKIGAQMVSATDGSAFTGAVTVYVTGDAGAQAVGSVGAGACTHEGNGFHTYAPAQAETNYDHIAFTFVGTGAIPSTIQPPIDFPQTGDAYATAVTVDGKVDILDTNLDALIADIGANGAGLTALPWNAAWDTEVQSECADALTAYAPATAANLATLQTTANDILTDTTEIGVAGAGLTNINLPNQTMDIVGNITGNLSGSVGSVTGLTPANLDVAVSTRLAAASYTAPDNSGIAAILADTGTDIPASIAALNNLSAAQVNAEVDAALLDVGLTTTITGRIDAAMSTRMATFTYTTPPTAAANAAAVRSELTTELARMDAAVSTRLAAASYTAPDNSGINTIGLIVTDILTDTGSTIPGALSTLQTSVNDIPTNSELTTALSGLATAAALVTVGNNVVSVSNGVDTLLTEVGTLDDKVDTIGTLVTTIDSRVDVAVSTRMATFAYTAPDNSSIAAVKIQTDKMVFTAAGALDANIVRVNEVLIDGSGTQNDPFGP